MTNQAKQILDELQYKTGKSLDEIAVETGYSRPYLSNVKKHGGGEKVMGRLIEYRNKILPNVPHETGITDFNQAAIMKLIESNRMLSDANKDLAAAHKSLAADQRSLMAKLSLVDPPDSDTEKLLMGVTELLLKVGVSAKAWPSVAAGQKELHKVASGKKVERKEGHSWQDGGSVGK
jgi:hypothetical protein